MTTDLETQTDQERRSLYIGIAVVLAVMVVVGLLMFKAALHDAGCRGQGRPAHHRARERRCARHRRARSLVRLLGDDGGAVCADPNGALSRATLLSQLSTGPGGPGSRPIIADSRVVQGELLIIKVYCPDELADFQEFVDDLEARRQRRG